MKPGIKTTEFWLTLFLVIILVTLAIFVVIKNPQTKSFIYSATLMAIAWLKAHNYEVQRVKQKMQEDQIFKKLSDRFPWIKNNFSWICGSGITSVAPNPPPAPPISAPVPPQTEKNSDSIDEDVICKDKCITATIKLTPKTSVTTITRK